MKYRLTIDSHFDAGDGFELRHEVIEVDSVLELIIPILNAIYDGVPFDVIHVERA